MPNSAAAQFVPPCPRCGAGSERPTTRHTVVAMTAVPNLSLSAGTTSIDIPQLGFGVWQVPEDEVVAAVSTALEVGYRQHRHRPPLRQRGGAGRGDREVRRPPRGALRHHEGLERRPGLRLDPRGLRRLDEAPRPRHPRPVPHPLARAGAGHVRRHLEGAAEAARGGPRPRRRRLQLPGAAPAAPHDETGELPAINQVELHPYLQQQELREFHAANGILTEAWSPLASGGDVLTDDTIAGIAEKHGVTPAQAILRWHLDLGNVVIPKSVTPSRIARELRHLRLRARRRRPRRHREARPRPPHRPEPRRVHGLTAERSVGLFGERSRAEEWPPGPAGSPCRPHGARSRVCAMSDAPDTRAQRELEEGIQRDFSQSMSYGATSTSTGCCRPSTPAASRSSTTSCCSSSSTRRPSCGSSCSSTSCARPAPCSPPTSWPRRSSGSPASSTSRTS